MSRSCRHSTCTACSPKSPERFTSPCHSSADHFTLRSPDTSFIDACHRRRLRPCLGIGGVVLRSRRRRRPLSTRCTSPCIAGDSSRISPKSSSHPPWPGRDLRADAEVNRFRWCGSSARWMPSLPAFGDQRRARPSLRAGACCKRAFVAQSSRPTNSRRAHRITASTNTPAPRQAR